MVLRLSTGNQRVLLHRARSKVRAALEQYGATVLDEPATGTGRAPATGPMRPAPRKRPGDGSSAQPRAPGRPAGPAPADQPPSPRDRYSP